MDNPGNCREAWLLNQPDTNTGLTYMENEEIVKGITGKPSFPLAYSKIDHGCDNACGCANSNVYGSFSGRPTFISSELFPTYLSSSQWISGSRKAPQGKTRIGKNCPKMPDAVKYDWNKTFNRATAMKDNSTSSNVPFRTIPSLDNGMPDGNIRWGGNDNSSTMIFKDLLPNRKFVGLGGKELAVALAQKEQIYPKGKERFDVVPTKHQPPAHPKLSIKDTIDLPKDVPQIQGLRAVAHKKFEDLHIPRLSDAPAPPPLQGSSLQIMTTTNCTSYTALGSVGKSSYKSSSGKPNPYDYIRK